MSGQQKLNILSIISYPFLPATTGGEISTLNILNYMAKKHDVTVFTVEPYGSNYKPETLHFRLISGMPFKSSRYWNVRLLPKLLRLIKQQKSDWLFFDQPWFGWLMLLLKIFSGKKIFMRSNNIEYLRFRSMGKWFWQMLYIYEKWTYRVADLVIFVSETDRQKAIYEFDLKPENTMLTPYGVEVVNVPVKTANARERLQQLYTIKPEEKILLFFATMSYFPNYQAVEFIADELYPLLKGKESFPFKILICGKNLPQQIMNKLVDKIEIIYCGFVEDINLYIDGADVMINPILTGGGVKTKAIDTLARNQRVISTQNGAEGIDSAVCGNNLIVVKDHDWNAFAEAIIHYVNLPADIPSSFYQAYSWIGIIDSLSLKLGEMKKS